jgi:hypothetical protein
MLNMKLATRTVQRDSCRTAYVTSYEAPQDFTFPEEFDLPSHDLLFTESIRSQQQTLVFLYWVSEERARAQEPVVEKALGINNAKVVGQVVQVLAPKMPKWTENPIKWGKWVVSAAALFGAMTVVRDNFTELFGSPDVVIFASNSAAADFHAGDQLDIPLVVRNQSRLGQADVHLESARLTPLDPTATSSTLQFNISEVPQLQAGQNAEVHMTGTSPFLHNSQPQKFRLDVSARAKEGLFWFTRNADYHAFTVTSWPDRSTEIRLERISPAIARVQITLRSGVPVGAGLRGQLTFSSAVPPEEDGIVLMEKQGVTSMGGPIVATGPTGSIAKVQFQTGPLQSFRRYSYAVSISFGRSLTEAEWNSLRSSLEVTFA